MFNFTRQNILQIAIARPDAPSTLAGLMKQAERGDADSSGSTMRVWGVVVLVVAVVLLVGAAIYNRADSATTFIQNVHYPW